MTNLLVVGIGNPYRHDDAAGLLAARMLKAMLPGGVTVLEESGEAVALMQAWAGADEVVLVDAISAGAVPGSLHCFEVGRDPLRADLFAASTHALGVAQAIELARLLGCLPARLTLYGIEGADFSYGIGLSPAVACSLPAIVQQIQITTIDGRPPDEAIIRKGGEDDNASRDAEYGLGRLGQRVARPHRVDR